MGDDGTLVSTKPQQGALKVYIPISFNIKCLGVWQF